MKGKVETTWPLLSPKGISITNDRIVRPRAKECCTNNGGHLCLLARAVSLDPPLVLRRSAFTLLCFSSAVYTMVTPCQPSLSEGRSHHENERSVIPEVDLLMENRNLLAGRRTSIHDPSQDSVRLLPLIVYTCWPPQHGTPSQLSQVNLTLSCPR